MKGFIWAIVNALLVLSSFLGGYRSMAPEKLVSAHGDIYMCAVILVVMPWFPLLIMNVAKSDRFRKPSWDRFPLNWWRDPLQALFVSTCCVFALALGGTLRVSGSGNEGVATVLSFWCIAIALSLGQWMGYAIYRDRIVDSHFASTTCREPAGGPWGFSWTAIVMVGLGLIFALAAVIARAFYR